MKSSRIAIITMTIILLSHLAASQTTDSDEERAFRIKPRPCTDRHGAEGTCMFQWECRQRNGLMLATCLDRFLFGTCCQLPGATEEKPSVATVEDPLPLHPVDNKVDIGTNNKLSTKTTPYTTRITTAAVTTPTTPPGQSSSSGTLSTIVPAPTDEMLAVLDDDSQVTFEGPGVLVSPTVSGQLNGSGGATYSTPDIDKLFHQFLGSVLSNYSDSQEFEATVPTLFVDVPGHQVVNTSDDHLSDDSDSANVSNSLDDTVSEQSSIVEDHAEVTSTEITAPTPAVNTDSMDVVYEAVTEQSTDVAGEQDVATATPAPPTVTTPSSSTTSSVVNHNTESPSTNNELLPETDPAVEYEYYDPDETTLNSSPSDQLSLASGAVTSMAPPPSPAEVSVFHESPLEDATEIVYDAELYEDDTIGTSPTTSTTTTTTTPAPTTTTRRTTTRPTTTKKPLDYHTDCGVRPLIPNGRIVGGTSSRFGEWPWQVLIKEATWLGLFVKNKCGGVLLNSRYVITAAHCQPSFLASLLVVFGENDLSVSNEEMKPLQRNVRRVVVHRKFNALTFDNDLALLELERSVEYRQHIVPICLPPDDADYTSRVAVVTGWGRLKYGGRLPTDLQQVDVPIIPNSKCQQMFLTAGHIKAIGDKFICAGYQEGAKDSCEGDSGGPLVLEDGDGRWVLIGTVSHGIKCAYPNLPGVYIKISAYKSWIQRIISS